MEQLIEHLNSYSKHGIPQLHSVDEDLEEGTYQIIAFRKKVTAVGAMRASAPTEIHISLAWFQIWSESKRTA